MHKIRFYLYTQEFKEIFEKEKKRIKKVLLNNAIHHIGSTAIPGVGGKGIIDILIALQNWKEKEKAIIELKKLGFLHIHPEENGRIFLSKLSNTKYKDVHIHLIEKDSKEYTEKLLFRDFLRRNRKEAKKYHLLKQKWEEQAKGDRKKYGSLKVSYIENIIQKIKNKDLVEIKNQCFPQ